MQCKFSVSTTSSEQNDWWTGTFCENVDTWYNLPHPQFTYFHHGKRLSSFGYSFIPINYDSCMASKFSVYESFVYESSGALTTH